MFASGSGLQRVPAGGGEARTLTTFQAGEFRHVSPHVLPDGKAVLFTALSRSGTMEDAEICVVSISTGERRTLLKGAGDARYSSSGHLLYVRQADLLGVPFDPKRLQVTGAPFLAAASIHVKQQDLYGSFDLATDGTLAWIASTCALSERETTAARRCRLARGR